MDKLTELKAQAYDAISQVEIWQNKLREINSLIEKEMYQSNPASKEARK